MLCTRHVGSLPKNCTLAFIQCLQQSQLQPGWVHLSTLSSFLCPYWTVKYHSRGRSLAEVDGWVARLAPCIHFRKDSLSVILKDGRVRKCYFIFPSLLSLEKAAEKRWYLSPYCHSSWQQGASCFFFADKRWQQKLQCFCLSPRWKVNLLIVGCSYKICYLQRIVDCSSSPWLRLHVTITQGFISLALEQHFSQEANVTCTLLVCAGFQFRFGFTGRCCFGPGIFWLPGRCYAQQGNVS